MTRDRRAPRPSRRPGLDRLAGLAVGLWACAAAAQARVAEAPGAQRAESPKISQCILLCDAVPQIGEEALLRAGAHAFGKPLTKPDGSPLDGVTVQMNPAGGMLTVEGLSLSCGCEDRRMPLAMVPPTLVSDDERLAKGLREHKATMRFHAFARDTAGSSTEERERILALFVADWIDAGTRALLWGPFLQPVAADGTLSELLRSKDPGRALLRRELLSALLLVREAPKLDRERVLAMAERAKLAPKGCKVEGNVAVLEIDGLRFVLEAQADKMEGGPRGAPGWEGKAMDEHEGVVHLGVFADLREAKTRASAFTILAKLLAELAEQRGLLVAMRGYQNALQPDAELLSTLRGEDAQAAVQKLAERRQRKQEAPGLVAPRLAAPARPASRPTSR